MLEDAQLGIQDLTGRKVSKGALEGVEVGAVGAALGGLAAHEMSGGSGHGGSTSGRTSQGGGLSPSAGGMHGGGPPGGTMQHGGGSMGGPLCKSVPGHCDCTDELDCQIRAECQHQCSAGDSDGGKW